MKLIRLTGKYAIGGHAFAIVDDDLYDELNRYRWKAKPNAKGSHVYAVRNTTESGMNKTIRMHRVVLGDDRGNEVVADHINHNTLDNRRENLRWCTKAENVHNTDKDRHRPRERVYLCTPHTCPVSFGHCLKCGRGFRQLKRTQKYCSDRCRYADKYLKRVVQRCARVLP